ncbi:hypothetical protein DIPPA_34929 [Diplonema papillatum]|nr:hypothetical protein DIPPA_34929 [Diplonema papillatum]
MVQPLPQHVLGKVSPARTRPSQAQSMLVDGTPSQAPASTPRLAHVTFTGAPPSMLGPFQPPSNLHLSGSPHTFTDARRPSPVRGRGPPVGMLGVMKARSPLLMELDQQADENYRHKVSGSTQLLPVQSIPDWSIRHAEDRLADADRRVRLLQSEAEQLDALKKQQLLASEEEVLRLKRKLLDDWEAREREWEARREEELRNIKLKEAMLDEQQQRLSELEDKLEHAMKDEDDKARSRTQIIELEHARFMATAEDRLRVELRNLLEADLRRELEMELTHRITAEIKHELQREFAHMCETMRKEVQHARNRMAAELERELEPSIEQRLLQQLYPTVRVKVEQEVHQTVLHQLKEANAATQLLRDELTTALDDRDRYVAELDRMKQELGTARGDLRQSKLDMANQQGEIDMLRNQLANLDAEHRLLQQAATGVLQQAKQAKPQRVNETNRMSPPRPRDTLVHHLNDAKARSGSYQPRSAGGSPAEPWPPQILPGGGILC